MIRKMTSTPVLVDINAQDRNLLGRLVVVIGLNLLNCCTNIHAPRNSSKDCMLLIQPRSWADCDEELGAIGIYK